MSPATVVTVLAVVAFVFKYDVARGFVAFAIPVYALFLAPELPATIRRVGEDGEVANVQVY